MKQLLLRVPDDLHRRLSERAAAAGVSVNTLATNALAITAASVAPSDPTTTVRLRAAAAGVLAEPPKRPESAPSTNEVRALLKTLDLTADELLPRAAWRSVRIAYLDSSIIVRRYIPSDTDHLEAVDWFEDPETAVVTSTLATIEVSGALVRAARNVRQPASLFLDRFDQDLADGQPTVLVASSSEIEPIAMELVRTRGIRALDALHVAAASQILPLLAGPNDTAVFVSRDAEQAAAAAALGLEVA